MAVYLDLVVLLNFGVDFLLLMGTNRLCGYPIGAKRAALAAIFGAVYAGCCMLPGFGFLGRGIWPILSLGAMAVIAFGWIRSALKRGILFVFLCMALGGIALWAGTGGFTGILAGAALVCLLAVIGFWGRIGSREFVTVKLRRGERCRVLTALRDTGNTLTDPVTGQQVLVVGPEVARELLGLTGEELRDPIAAVSSGRIPGLRLIPYRSVGCSGGMLPAMAMDEVTVNGKPTGRLVAFAPQTIGNSEGYQALAGGSI